MNDNPLCNCGFGGFHDDINPRCVLNQRVVVHDRLSDEQVAIEAEYGIYTRRMLAREVQESRTRIAALETEVEKLKEVGIGLFGSLRERDTRIAALEAAIDGYVAHVDNDRYQSYVSINDWRALDALKEATK